MYLVFGLFRFLFSGMKKVAIVDCSFESFGKLRRIRSFKPVWLRVVWLLVVIAVIFILFVVVWLISEPVKCWRRIVVVGLSLIPMFCVFRFSLSHNLLLHIHCFKF